MRVLQTLHTKRRASTKGFFLQYLDEAGGKCIANDKRKSRTVGAMREKKHNNKHGPKAEIDLHEDDDVLQNEYDCDFWLKVSLIKCLKYFDHLTS